MLRDGRRRGRRWACVLAALLCGISLLGGCGERRPKKENIREVVEAQDRARKVKAQADLPAINAAVQEYYAENGRFPDRLDALPFIQDRRIDTSSYAYDPANGQVRMREP